MKTLSGSWHWRSSRLAWLIFCMAGTFSNAAPQDGPPPPPGAGVNPLSQPIQPTPAQAQTQDGRLATPPANYVWIPPGHFTLGSPVTETDRSGYEGPAVEVTLTKGFYMGKFLVTQGEYVEVMRTNTSRFTGDPSRPVEACGWFAATNYCGKLTLREQNAGRLPATWCYRLPTEAEWEYACRAGTTTRFSYGDDPGYTNLTNYGWYDGNSYVTNKPSGYSYKPIDRVEQYFITHAVGTKLPNPWGLYDMHGSLSEWCLDWFGNNPGSKFSLTDPQGPAHPHRARYPQRELAGLPEHSSGPPLAYG